MSTPEFEINYGDEATYIRPRLEEAIAVDDPSLAPTDTVAPTRHSALTRWLHWGTALALVVSIGAMLMRDAIENDGLRAILLGVHRQLGIAVFIAAAFRIIVRIAYPLATHGKRMALWVRAAATGTHLAVYGLLLGLPLVGWALMSAHDTELTLFGIVRLPPLVQEDSDFADTLDNVHVKLAWILLGCVILHAAAALWHHFVLRDRVLRAMLPGKD